ncbi:MAG: hypothetical protein K0Q97_618, partial [Bacillota bacterium]|nr:hypothetical protein [Bacillota bacterium]
GPDTPAAPRTPNSSNRTTGTGSRIIR